MQEQEKQNKKLCSRHDFSNQRKFLQEHEIKRERLEEKSLDQKIKREGSYDKYKQEKRNQKEKSCERSTKSRISREKMDGSRSKRRKSTYAKHKIRSNSRNKASGYKQKKVSIFSRIGHRTRSISNHRRRRSKSRQGLILWVF